MLLRNGASRLTQFKCQCILVDLLQKSGPERIQHGECAAYDGPGRFIQLIPIRVFGVHLPGICVKPCFTQAANKQLPND
jgi:hypothetical protein